MSSESKNLRSRDLSGKNLVGAYFLGADFSYAVMRGVNMYCADLRSASFIGAAISEAVLEKAFVNDAIFRGADLRGTTFLNADCRGADFQVADLRGASFVGADLRGTRFSPRQLMNEEATFDPSITWAIIEGYRINLAPKDGGAPLDVQWGGDYLRVGDFVADITEWENTPLPQFRAWVCRDCGEEEAARILAVWEAHRGFLLGLGNNPYHPSKDDASRGIIPVPLQG